VVSGTPGIRAVQRATTTIPVVFVYLADPVTSGFVPSLSRPGGNLTGLGSQFEELVTKQLQLLKEAIPKISVVGLLHHAGLAPGVLTGAQTAARNTGLTTRTLKVTEAADLENAFKAARTDRAGAIQVLPSPYLNALRDRLIELAARYRLPAMYEFKNYVQDGGLMS
jgi:putative ABC transport system substrate-binding protein